MKIAELFEAELSRRGLRHTLDPRSGLYSITVGQTATTVSLDNLQREFAQDGDKGRVTRFIDAIVRCDEPAEAWSADRVFWSLEPNDHVEPAAYRKSVSDRVDRVLVHLSEDGLLITWVTDGILRDLGLSAEDAADRASANLARSLTQASVTVDDIDGVALGMIGTKLPFKAAFILAPNLKEVIARRIGWPVLAVVPDRDFLYLWDERHSDFTGRVGRVVVDNFLSAGYPISPEVFRISDDGLEAIGEFPTGQDQAKS